MLVTHVGGREGWPREKQRGAAPESAPPFVWGKVRGSRSIVQIVVVVNLSRVLPGCHQYGQKQDAKVGETDQNVVHIGEKLLQREMPSAGSAYLDARKCEPAGA
jgi:hypothetical protein